MTTPTTATISQRCREHLDRMRPTFRLFQDVLDRYENDHELDPSADPSVGLSVLRMLSEEIRRDAEQLDLDLHHGCRPMPNDYGWESEGGQI